MILHWINLCVVTLVVYKTETVANGEFYQSDVVIWMGWLLVLSKWHQISSDVLELPKRELNKDNSETKQEFS